MEKIEGIDLVAMTERAKAEALEAQRVKVVGILRHYYDRRAGEYASVKRLRAELEAAEKKLAATEAIIAKVEAGEWQPLKEPEGKSQREQPAE